MILQYFVINVGKLLTLFEDASLSDIIISRLPQLKTYNGGNPYNTVGWDALLHHLAKNFGKHQIIWKAIDKCLLYHAKENGVEFLSLSRGWDKDTNQGAAQGDQILKILLKLENNPDIQLTNETKKAVFEKLLSQNLYKLPKLSD
ncbi:MAG: hypothetical protein RCG15_09035 [Candidatus Rickettsia vulgarisii]